MKYVIIVGDLRSGIETIYGPFDTIESAHDWASNCINHNKYIIKRILKEYIDPYE